LKFLYVKKNYYFGYTSVSKIFRHFFPDRNGTNMAGHKYGGAHIDRNARMCQQPLWLQNAGSMAPVCRLHGFKKELTKKLQDEPPRLQDDCPSWLEGDCSHLRGNHPQLLGEPPELQRTFQFKPFSVTDGPQWLQGKPP
jgi:hypothetical protein